MPRRLEMNESGQFTWIILSSWLSNLGSALPWRFSDLSETSKWSLFRIKTVCCNVYLEDSEQAEISVDGGGSVGELRVAVVVGLSTSEFHVPDWQSMDLDMLFSIDTKLRSWVSQKRTRPRSGCTTLRYTHVTHSITLLTHEHTRGVEIPTNNDTETTRPIFQHFAQIHIWACV